MPAFNCKGLVYLADADGRFLRSAFTEHLLPEAGSLDAQNALRLLQRDGADSTDVDESEATHVCTYLETLRGRLRC